MIATVPERSKTKEKRKWRSYENGLIFTSHQDRLCGGKDFSFSFNLRAPSQVSVIL
jgi:hypothetical protein